jgi:hypothetical protein
MSEKSAVQSPALDQGKPEVDPRAETCWHLCQPKSLWIRPFADRGFAFDETLTGRWERENAEVGLAS